MTIQAQILELMVELQDRLGMSILLITHDLGAVAETCDDVVVMYAGPRRRAGARRRRVRLAPASLHRGASQSIPVLGMSRHEPLRVIRGNVPSPLDWPQGCRFAPRCDYAFEKCSSSRPCSRSTLRAPPAGCASTAVGPSRRRPVVQT